MHDLFDMDELEGRNEKYKCKNQTSSNEGS